MSSLARFMLLVGLLLFASTAASRQDEILKSYLQSGLLALREGESAKAETLFRSAISEIPGASMDQDSKTSAMIVSLNGLSAALMNQQKYADAESVTRKQITLMELVRQTDSADYFVALNNLGLVLTHRKQYNEAIETHRKALGLREKYLERADPDIAVSLLNLGKVYFDLNKHIEAEAFLLRAVSILTKIPTQSATDENMIALAICDMNLSSIKVGQKKYQEAEEYLLIALMIRTKLQGPSHPDLLEPLRNYSILCA